MLNLYAQYTAVEGNLLPGQLVTFGGTLNGSSLTWDVLRIVGVNGSAQVQFWGTLIC